MNWELHPFLSTFGFSVRLKHHAKKLTCPHAFTQHAGWSQFAQVSSCIDGLLDEASTSPVLADHGVMLQDNRCFEQLEETSGGH